MRQNSPSRLDDVSEGNSSGAERHPGGTHPAIDEQSARTFRGLRNLAARITPWLVDVGSWIFGGLIAVNLVVFSALITVGPVDAAIRTSTAALAAALPLNVAGIVLLRLIKDVNDVGLDDLTLRAFRDAGFPDVDAYFPSPGERASQHSRRSRVALLYSLGIAAVSVALTAAGVAAAGWHMGHWIAWVFLFSIMLSVVLVTVAIAHALPPESDAEKSLQRRHKEHRSERVTRQRE
jgi:hypothetical protein